MTYREQRKAAIAIAAGIARSYQDIWAGEQELRHLSEFTEAASVFDDQELAHLKQLTDDLSRAVELTQAPRPEYDRRGRQIL